MTNKTDRRRAHYAANRDRQIASSKAWAAANPERAKATQQAHRAAHPHYHTARNLVSKARRRAELCGQAFDGSYFTVARVEAQLRHNLGCDCCGAEMSVEPKGKIGPALNSPTLDRINPKGGYVRGNVALICWRCNRLKSDATAAELHRIAYWMERRAL